MQTTLNYEKSGSIDFSIENFNNNDKILELYKSFPGKVGLELIGFGSFHMET